MDKTRTKPTGAAGTGADLAARGVENASDLRVEEFEDRHRADFERLNVEWLERYFAVEPIDRALFAEPRRLILDAGGTILMATLDGDVVGTAALLPTGAGSFELAKMAVTERAQAKGVGELLVRACIERARAKGAKQLDLMTNSRLERAGRLYRRLGFRVVATGQNPKYVRVDTVMTLDLNDA